MKKITTLELKNRLSEIIEKVKLGEPFTIHSQLNQKPFALIIPTSYPTNNSVKKKSTYQKK